MTGDGKHELSLPRHRRDRQRLGAARCRSGSTPRRRRPRSRSARGAGVEGADSATLSLHRHRRDSAAWPPTVYRIDGGDWATVGAGPITVQGFGKHVVDFASTDVAGNPELMRQRDGRTSPTSTTVRRWWRRRSPVSPEVGVDADGDDRVLEHQGPDLRLPVAA